MGDVAGAVGAVGGLDGFDGGIFLAEEFAEIVHELIKGGAVAESGVVYLVYGFGIFGGEREHVHLYHVVDIGEVARVFAVAVDVGRFVSHEFLYEEGDYGRVCSVGVLAASKYVEVAQADVFSAVGAGKHVGIKLVDVFCDGIWRKGAADYVFHFGQ